MAWTLLTGLGEAVLRLLIHPFFYLGLVLILLQYRRQIQLERKLFHVRLHYLFIEAWHLLLWGTAAGLGVSLVMGLLGAAVTAEAVLLLWGISLVLILFRIRFLCMAYAAGILGVVRCILDWVPGGSGSEAFGWLYRWMDRVDVPGLLALAGVLHLAEALLVRTQGSRSASPLFYDSKRGKPVGGYHMYGFWPLALFLLVPVSGGGGFELPWSPVFGSELATGGWTVMAMPVVLGFTERTLSRLPKEKARRSAGFLMAYALAVTGMALLAHWVAVLLLPAALLTIALHELLIWFSGWEESKRAPLFVHGLQGLKILAVLPGSPAAELGIEAGETIEKINGVRVRTREELHGAFQINPAFCRMEILNLEGQTKFVSRAVFAGDHHQLGVLLCPDDDARYIVEERRRVSLLSVLLQAFGGLQEKKGSKSA
ncbi:PDZ domain-containing protein [Gorillibacterium sp. sgz5001074]|uniref:PDZ domain-containing protein n=1 Tax=Gorillibacterium sp. sgz5001074 TaxID=3446695 RepID=UPI003F669737